MGEETKRQYSKTFVSFCLLMNIGLSISIVLLNKTVYTRYGFPNITLTCIHFICTTIGMVICRFLGLFTVKTLPISKMLPISITFCGFVVLTNLSLQTNTVGTYQIIKTMTMPCIMIIQTVYYSRTFSTKIRLTVIPIVVGVILNSYFDIKFSLLGVGYALAGVLVTALYQVWVNEKQKEMNVDAMQMLYYQAPLSAICVACIIPIFEPVTGPGGILSPWSTQAKLMVAATGVVAFAINMSIFWIIGNTSPLTYNMVGHLKFGLTLMGGFILFKDPIQLLQGCGIFLTFSGVFIYTHFKLQEQKAAKELEEANKRAQQQEELAKHIITIDNGKSQPVAHGLQGNNNQKK